MLTVNEGQTCVNSGLGAVGTIIVPFQWKSGPTQQEFPGISALCTMSMCLASAKQPTCFCFQDYMVSRGPAVEHLLDTSETPWLSTRRRRKLPLQKAVVVTSVAGDRVSEGPLTAWRA